MQIRITVLFAILLAVTSTSAPAATASLQIISGVDDNGRATALWRQIIRKHLPGEQFRAVEHLEKPFTADERAWAELVRSRREAWEAEIPVLAGIFRPVAAPDARIVLGNRGGNDAFTHDPHTIAFDLSRLHAVYGGADEPGSRERIDRFFRHEYTHLLQKAWLQETPYAADMPLSAALLGIWLEGAGNYYSMSDSWRASDGKPSAKAQKMLAVLEPRFVTRLAALACAGDEDANQLMADLSMGRFDRKWGALTAALWIEQEAGTSDDVLRNFVLAGPEGVWELAERHLSAPMKPVLDEIRETAEICRGQ